MPRCTDTALFFAILPLSPCPGNKFPVFYVFQGKRLTIGIYMGYYWDTIYDIYSRGGEGMK
jgi:hypothetical protein